MSKVAASQSQAKKGSKPGKPAVGKRVSKPSTKRPSKETPKGKKASAKPVVAKPESAVDRKRRLFKQYAELLRADSTEDKQSVVSAVLKEKEASDLPSFVQGHAGSRLVQACLKYGSPVQRQSIIAQFTPEETAKSTSGASSYGLLAVEKLVNYGDKKFVLEKLVEPLLADGKRLTSMLFHRTGARFVEFLYSHKELPTAMKRKMVEVLTGGTRMLVKTSTAEFVKKCVDKELLHLTVVHRILKVAVIDKFPDLMDTEEDAKLPVEALAQLLGSREGVEVLLAVLNRLNPKEKKTLIKSEQLKNKFVEIAGNSVCAVFLLKLLAVVDDTVLTSKAVVTELLDSLPDLAYNQFGRTAFLFLYGGMDVAGDAVKRYFAHDDRLAMAAAAPLAAAGKDSAGGSKKADAVKAKELLAKAAPVLETFVSANFLLLAQDVLGKDLAVEVLRHKLRSAGGRKFLSTCLKTLKTDDLSVHTVTVLLVLLKSECAETSETAATALNEFFLMNTTELLSKMLSTRWAFVALELVKKPALLSEILLGKLKEAVKAIDEVPETAKGLKALLEALGTAKAGLRLDADEAMDAENANANAEAEAVDEDDGLMLMDDE